MTSVRRRPSPPSRERDTRRGRRTVVAVGDVEASHRVECVRQTLDGPRVAEYPGDRHLRQRLASVLGMLVERADALEIVGTEEILRKGLVLRSSGIFGHVSAVGKISATRYSKSESGYMRVRAWADGRIRITVFTVDIKGQTSEAFDEWASQARNKKPEAKHAD